MVWTQFWDMHSGGPLKEKWAKIYIEAPEEEAKVIFYNRFGHNPDRVTCTCCGPDYSISEYKTLEEATEYHRSDYIDTSKGDFSRKVVMSVKEFFSPGHKVASGLSKEPVLKISKKEIKANERIGELPEEGYIWH